jgi:ribonuclease R
MTKKTKKSKEDKLFDNLLKVTRQYMTGRSFVPLSLTELTEKLQIPPQHKQIFLKAINTLIKNGDVELAKGRYHWKEDRSEVVSGVIRMHHRGFGFVETDDQNISKEDVFIPKHLTGNAVDGDRVEIIINHESISEKGPEGRVINIVKRGRTHIAGIIRDFNKHGEIIAYVPILGLSQRVVVDPAGNKTLVVGDRIIMEVIDWGTKDTETLARFSQFLSHISDHQGDTKAAIESFSLRAEFPDEVINEAHNFGTSVPRTTLKDREDLRELECITIDPDTAKDFDDALTLTKDKKGNYHLGVHIADVTHYVRPGTALDEEARKRCNSTYFPDYCLPMLPKELSNNLCSLKPRVNRLTVSVLMVIDKKGDLVDYRIARTVIKSQKRFTYKEAKQVLEKKKPSPHYKMLSQMEELCHLLKKKRFERGSLDLSLPDLVVIVDEEGFPQRTEYVEYDITHQLVEEFMLKANEIIATDLCEKGKDLTYRVHDLPAEENIKDFVALARSFGFELADTPTPEELQTFFDKATETPYGAHLASSYIRRMRMAVYSPENIGHYGLSLTHYCHFTSPIRRYADLIVHRILFNEEMSRQELENISNQCSEQERISAKAETSVILLKKLRLLDAIHQHDPATEFDAVITQVKPWGITIDIPAFMLESFIHVSELGDEYFEYEERAMRFRGTSTGAIFRSGEDIKVMLRSVNFIILESKWDIISPPKKETKKSSKKEKNVKKTVKKEQKQAKKPVKKVKKNAKDRKPGKPQKKGAFSKKRSKA